MLKQLYIIKPVASKSLQVNKLTSKQVNELTNKRANTFAHQLVYFPTRLLVNFLTCFLLFACTNRPSNVLSEQKMEAVLFELYQLEAAINENRYLFANDSTRKAQSLKSVFDKHKISEAKFDTSLVWYNANLNKYLKINEKLNKRYEQLINELQAEQELVRQASTLVDTFYLFQKPTVWLSSKKGAKLFSLCNSDSSEINHIRTYDLKFDVLGLQDSIFTALRFFIVCNDTTIVFNDTIRQDGRFEKQYMTPNHLIVNEVEAMWRLSDSCRHEVLVVHPAVFQQQITILPMDSIRRVLEEKNIIQKKK